MGICKKPVLKRFAECVEKHLYQSLFDKTTGSRTTTLLKRDSDTVDFLRIFRDFPEQIFHRSLGVSLLPNKESSIICRCFDKSSGVVLRNFVKNPRKIAALESFFNKVKG